jgi:hypothetical protein
VFGDGWSDLGDKVSLRGSLLLSFEHSGWYGNLHTSMSTRGRQQKDAHTAGDGGETPSSQRDCELERDDTKCITAPTRKGRSWA